MACMWLMHLLLSGKPLHVTFRCEILCKEAVELGARTDACHLSLLCPVEAQCLPSKLRKQNFVALLHIYRNDVPTGQASSARSRC